MNTRSEWIDASLLRDFEAEGTDAHRLCTIEDGWVERFGPDLLISFRRVLAREHLVQELHVWATAVRFGATTVNIDLSKKSLERGRENFELNSLATIDHRFIADDLLAVLPRLARKGEKFDMIILDPPTFSRAPGGKTFHVENDFEKLLVNALELAERDSRILLSTT